MQGATKRRTSTILCVAALMAAAPVQAHEPGAGVSPAYAQAPLIQIPLVTTAPGAVPLQAASWPAFAAHDLSTHGAPAGTTLYVGHDASTVYLGLHYPGSGWSAFAWSEEGRGPAQVVSITPLPNGTWRTLDAFAANLTAELENRPDTSLGGTDSVHEANATFAEGWSDVLVAFPMESGDAYDPSLEVGEVHTFVVAFNSTSREVPSTLDEGTQVTLRVVADRATDNPQELHHLFTGGLSPWPSVASLLLVAGAGVWLAVVTLRRPRA